MSKAPIDCDYDFITGWRKSSWIGFPGKGNRPPLSRSHDGKPNLSSSDNLVIKVIHNHSFVNPL